MTAAIVSGGGRMQYRVLGPVQVLRDGEEIPLGRRPQMLLALLLINANQVVSTDRIIDELWGDDPGRDPQNALWVVISRLRGILDPEREKRTDGSVLVTQHPGYRLVVDDDAVDVRRFERLARRGRDLLDTDPQQSAELLAEALGLWCGRAYESFAYDDFAMAEIVRLESMRLEAVEDRVEAELALGHARDLVASLEGLVRENPSRQRLVGQLMRALHFSGRQSDALRVFSATKARLIEEQGLEPSVELARLEEQILLDDPQLRPRREADGAPGVLALSVRGYELREHVRSSPSDDVYRAYQPAVGREVEIRVIGAELANDADFIRRFEADAQLIAQLDDPQIVPVFDFWREPDSAYLVTRLFEHGTLQAVLDTEPLQVDEALAMLRQISGAIVSAHRRGVAHGDVSADSVMVDADRNAYLSNFGPASTIDLRNDGVDDEVRADHCRFAELCGLLLRHTVDSVGEPFAMDARLVALIERHAVSSTGEAGFLGFVDEVLEAVSEGSARRTSSVEAVNPYQGLRAFGEDDAGRFHGRERLIERLVSRIGHAGPQGRFVAVVGPSGSGKSSVVRAGVVPALRNGAAAGSDRWFIVTMSPGRSAFQSLADALLRIAVNPPQALAERLQTDGISLCAERISPDPSSQILVVVDQFEELFTQSNDADAFIAALAEVVADKHSGVKIVATLRADFYDRPLRYAALGDPLRLGTEVITPMSPEELERAITRPAAAEGVEFAPGVVAQITADMTGQPAALPLLQHALTELFDRREHGVIGADAYAAVGGVGGALARRAELLLSELEVGGQAAARNVFLRLVTVKEGAADTRRRASTRELHDAGGGKATQILDLFGDHRLLTFDQDPSTRAPTAEIAHEALLTRWTTLKGWIDEARSAVRAQRRLAEATNEWTAAGEDPGLLLAGSRLANYSGWLDDPPVPLTGDEQRFLAVSEAAGRAELEAERTRAVRFRRLASMAAGAFVVAAIAAGLAIWQQGRASDAADLAEEQAAIAQDQTEVAEEQRTIAEEAAVLADVERMRAQAVAEVDTNAPLAALLAVEAYNTDRSHLSAGAIQRVLTSVDGRRATLSDSLADYAGPSAMSADGRLIAVSSANAVDVWDVDARTLHRRVEVEFARFDLSDDGTLLAYSALDREGIRLYDVTAGVEVGVIPSRPCQSIDIAPDRKRIAFTSDAQGAFDCGATAPRAIEIWDVSDPAEPALEHRGVEDSGGVVWNPAGTGYVSVDSGGSVEFWDASSHELLWSTPLGVSLDQFGPGARAQSTGALFRSDGSSVVVGVTFAASSRGILLYSFDTETGELVFDPLSTAGLGSMNWWDEEETQIVGTFFPSGVGVFDLELAAEVLPSPFENPNGASVFVDHDRNRLVVSGFVGIEVSTLDGSAALERRIPLTPPQMAVKEQSDGQVFGSMSTDGNRLLLSVLDLTGQSPVVEWDLTTDPPTVVAEHPPGFTFSQGDVTLVFGGDANGPNMTVLDGDLNPIGTPASMEAERGFPLVWRSSADGSAHGPLRGELGVIDVYDGATGERIGEFTVPDRREDVSFFVSSIYSFSDDGSVLLANFGSDDRGNVWAIYDIATGELLGTGGDDELGRPWVAGDVIYSNPPGSFDLERRDLETLEEIGPPLVGHTLILNSIRDSKEGDLIVTQATNGNVRVWDRETGDQVGDAISIGRQAAGTDLVTARENALVGVILDTELAIWNYDIESWPGLACELAGRNMTQREWEDFGPQGAEYQVTCPEFPPGS